jgi:nucleoside-diphosphate-sugar epimerase
MAKGFGMNLFIFGLGYSSQHFLADHGSMFTKVTGTVRDAKRAHALSNESVEVLAFDGTTADPRIKTALAQADRLLVSIPPDSQGDPALARFHDLLAASQALTHVVYLATVGVYGDHAGAWIDETTHCKPANDRSQWRLTAEAQWIAFGRETGRSVHVLRLSGIYGPGQNALANLKAGTARRIVKPGQVFNRIHVADIGRAIDASFRTAGLGVWNVTDDEPAPPQDVVLYAANLLGIEPPPVIAFEEANMSPMARSFYGECKRVRNGAMKERLGVTLAYPSYREALDALFAAGEGR